jgi:hypothetical protein
MAKCGYKIMDSDMHVFEPADLWQRYIDPKYTDRAPVGLNRSFRDLGIKVEGKVLPIPREPENPALAKYRHDFFSEKYGDAGKRNFDSVSQIEAMNKEGLDVAVLFPTRGLCVLGIDGFDPELATAIARAYNDWLHDFAQTAPDHSTASPWWRRMTLAQQCRSFGAPSENTVSAGSLFAPTT